MTAKEIFKELGYELIIKKKYLHYCDNKYEETNIYFLYENKTLMITGEKEQFNPPTAQEIWIDEFKAITQQMKELGWLDD